jgi:hypothetical protein
MSSALMHANSGSGETAYAPGAQRFPLAVASWSSMVYLVVADQTACVQQSRKSTGR